MVKVMFPCIWHLGITGYTCIATVYVGYNRNNTTVLLFSCNCLCRLAENKTKRVNELEYLNFTQRLGDGMPN